MYLVVYIKAARKNIVIPEKWCFDIDEEKLKNRGVNSNQDIRIFWSEIGVDIHGQPDCEYTPKFDLYLANQFPPEIGLEACYIGRSKHYYSK